MEHNRHHQTPSGDAGFVLNLTAKEAAFVDAECLALGISHVAYFEKLIEADTETGIFDRSSIISILVSRGVDRDFKAMQNRPPYRLVTPGTQRRADSSHTDR